MGKAKFGECKACTDYLPLLPCPGCGEEFCFGCLDSVHKCEIREALTNAMMRGLDRLTMQSKEAELLDWAWSIIANAGGGNWERESPEWREAAAKYRDAYHKFLGGLQE